MQDLSQYAISLALRGNWNQALKINLQILKKQKADADALNRAAKCYAELGKIQKAREFAQKVLQIDPVNSIAQKCVIKWETMSDGFTQTTTFLSANIFLEEPGKTKIVPLVKLSDPKSLLCLDCGYEVNMEIRKRYINIVSSYGKYIGKLPDDISVRLINLIKQGNEYKVYIKTASAHEVKVFVKELKRSKQISHISSFPTEKIQYVSFTAPELVHNKKPVSSA